jgi:hypothetical protein
MYNQRSGVQNPLWGNFPNQMEMNKPTIQYQDTQIIQTKHLKTVRKIPYRLIIRSLDRNYQYYPNPNYFQVQLPEEYRDVLQIRLKNAKIPQSVMNIKRTNNIFYFQEVPETVMQVRVPIGNYSANALATKLQTLINEISMANIVVTTQSNDGGVTHFFQMKSDFSNGAMFFRILTFDVSCVPGTSSTTYTFDQKVNMNQYQPLSNPIFPTLGYERKDYLYLPTKVTGYQGDTTLYIGDICVGDYYQIGDVLRFLDNTDTTVYTITGIQDDHTIDIMPALSKSYMGGIVFLSRWKGSFRFAERTSDTILLRIEELSYIRSTSPYMKDIFSIIYNNNVSASINNNSYIYINDSDNEERDYNPPIPRLSKLTIECLDLNGERYDFEEDNMFLDLEIICVNSPAALEDAVQTTI